MPGIEIRNLPRTTDIDDIYNGLVPLSINNETVAAVFGVALGSVTNCLNAALYYSDTLSGNFYTLSTIQITNNAKITNLATQALTANSEIFQLGNCLDAKASIGCVNTIQNEIDTIDGRVSANSTDITQINNSVTNLNDVLTLKSDISTVDGISNSVEAANTRIDNSNAEIALINTTLTQKAGCTDVNSINLRTTQLEQTLQQSAVDIKGAAANTLFLSACIDGNTGNISQNAANVVTLENQLSGLCNNLVNANASDILLLNTQMSDVNTLTSNFIAAQAAKLTLLDTSLQTSAADVCQIAKDQLNLQSCVSTLTSQLLTSGARIDLIETQGFANASDITTINNGITALNLSLGTNFVDQTNLSASFLTQTFNISSLSAEMVTTIQNLTAKASADQAELISADVRAVSATAGTASTRTTQLCSEIQVLSTNTLTPTFTSLVVQINNRAFANDLEQLSTFATVNNTAITNLDSRQTVLESDINSVRSTFITGLTAPDGAVLGPGSVVFDAITAKANLTDFAFLSSCIDTEVADVDYTYGRLNALSALVESVSSNTGGLSSEIAARATCGDFFSLRTQLTGGEYATAASIFGENGLEAAINTTIETCNSILSERINSIDSLSSSFVAGDLRGSINTLINGITGNPASLNLAISSNFTLLSSYFDNLSSFTGSFNTSYNFLSGQFAQLSAFAQSLSGNIINDALTVAIETKASVTCFDNLRLAVDANALSSFGEIQTGKAESLVLSGITTNIINTIGDGTSPDTLSAAVLQRATLTEVCSLYNNITGGVLSGVGTIGGSKEGITSMQSQILALSSSVTQGITGLRNTLSAVNDIVDICVLKNTVEVQGLSATSLCNNVAALNTTLANVSAGTVNVALSAVNSLESRLNAVECGFGGFLDGSICQTCNVITTINSNIADNKSAADNSIASLNSSVGTAQRCADQALEDACCARQTGLDANNLACLAFNSTLNKADNSTVNTLVQTVDNQADIISSNTTAASDAKNDAAKATRNANTAKCCADQALLNTTEANNKIANINSVYGIKVNAQGHVAGFDLIANAKVSEGGQVQSGDSSFIVTADRFVIAGQDSQTPEIQPFVVENNFVKIQGACIKDLSVDTLQLANNSVNKITFIECRTAKTKSQRVCVRSNCIRLVSFSNLAGASSDLQDNAQYTGENGCCVTLVEAPVVTALGRPFTTDITVTRCGKSISQHLGRITISGTCCSRGTARAGAQLSVCVGKRWILTRKSDTVNGGECIVYSTNTTNQDDRNFRIVDCIPVDSKSYCSCGGGTGVSGKVVTVTYCWKLMPILFQHGTQFGPGGRNLCGLLSDFRGLDWPYRRDMTCNEVGAYDDGNYGYGINTVCDANGTTIGEFQGFCTSGTTNIKDYVNYFTFNQCMDYCICPLDVIFDAKTSVR